MRGHTWCALWLATALVLVPAPQAGAAAQPAAGREQVVIGISQEPDFLNPMFAGMAAAGSVLSTIFTGDVERDENWKLFPQGVEYLPSLKDGTWKISGSRMTVVWKLKPRRWHDGQPVTCDDYVFADRVARDERVPVTARDLTRRIEKIVCVNGPRGTGIRVEWKERYAYANLGISEYGAVPRHILERYYRQNPGKLDQAPYGNDPAVTIGDGVYRLVEWRKGASITVVSAGTHPIFGTPKIQRITWKIIPDTSALVVNMLSGAIDAISSVGISFDEALEIERQSAGRFNVFFAPGLTWEHLDFNLSNPFLKDLRVRRAIAYAIDRERMVQQLFSGKQPVAHSYLPPLHPGYTDEVEKYSYDPEKARALLRGAGFVLHPDGVVRDSNGKKLALKINTTAGNRAREQIEQIIQQNLKAVGIEVTIFNYPARVLFGDVTIHRKFTGMVMYAWVMSPTSDCDLLYTSDGIPSEANHWEGQNYPGYRNPEMDRLCKAASREIDEPARTQALQASAKILALDLPSLPLYFRVRVGTAKVGLVNYDFRALNEMWSVHRWFWQ